MKAELTHCIVKYSENRYLGELKELANRSPDAVTIKQLQAALQNYLLLVRPEETEIPKAQEPDRPAVDTEPASKNPFRQCNTTKLV